MNILCNMQINRPLILNLSMSKKLLQVDNNEGPRLLELSTNVNDYDTGEPFNYILGGKLSKNVDPHLEIKTGDKYRP